MIRLPLQLLWDSRLLNWFVVHHLQGLKSSHLDIILKCILFLYFSSNIIDLSIFIDVYSCFLSVCWFSIVLLFGRILLLLISSPSNLSRLNPRISSHRDTFSSSQADIRNPSLQLCWQGLASLLAHERSRFAIYQRGLSTPTAISISLTRRLVLRALETGGMLICVQIISVIRSYFLVSIGTKIYKTFCTMFHVKHISFRILLFSTLSQLKQRFSRYWCLHSCPGHGLHNTLDIFRYECADFHEQVAKRIANILWLLHFHCCQSRMLWSRYQSQLPYHHLSAVPGKADIRNPSLQLCWQGLSSLLAHERSRFAICQWELSNPTGRSIPLTCRLVLRTLEAGGVLICVQN